MHLFVKNGWPTGEVSLSLLFGSLFRLVGREGATFCPSVRFRLRQRVRIFVIRIVFHCIGLRVGTSVRWLVGWLVCWSATPSVCNSVRLSLRPSICYSVCASLRPSICLFQY